MSGYLNKLRLQGLQTVQAEAIRKPGMDILKLFVREIDFRTLAQIY